VTKGKKQSRATTNPTQLAETTTCPAHSQQTTRGTASKRSSENISDNLVIPVRVSD
jgi:hypothetical protein